MTSKKKSKNSTVAHTSSWRVAVHEAGHAVVAHALGVQVGDVTIEPGVTKHGDKYAGLTLMNYDACALLRGLDEYYDADADEDDGAREEEMLQFQIKSMQVSFGGKLAEELFFGAAEDAGFGPDLESINDLAERVCPPDPQELDEKKVDAPPRATYEECLKLAQEKLATVPKWEEDYFKETVKIILDAMRAERKR